MQFVKINVKTSTPNPKTIVLNIGWIEHVERDYGNLIVYTRANMYMMADKASEEIICKATGFQI